MEHFKDAERGFSIKLEGELDMRYDRSKGISAKQRLQQVKFLELVEIFEKYTDFGEKYRKWITEELLVARNKVPLATTKDLQVWAR
jgi:16S rRNA (cytosine1402-N4)-methyltransferase